MSTSEIKRTVVTVKRGASKAALLQELRAAGVEIDNERADSERNFDVMLSSQAAEALRGDERVMDVRWGTKTENGIAEVPCAVQMHGYSQKTGATLIGSAWDNWGLIAASSEANPYPAGGSLASFAREYSLDGAGVDLVIADSSPAFWDHPEWLDDAGQSRFVRLEWQSASGVSDLPATPPSVYASVTDSHGTLCAGTAAGRRYGFAKGAAIYTIGVNGTWGISTTQALSAVRNWHLRKRAAGNMRPTVLSGSFGSVYVLDTAAGGITGGSYRGSPFTGSMSTDAARAALLPYKIPAKRLADLGWAYNYVDAWSGALTAEVESCIDAGIVVVGPSANWMSWIDVPGGPDYDNTVTAAGGGPLYYCRGSWSAQDEAICVGAYGADVTTDNKERLLDYGGRGPRVDVYAPGKVILTAATPSATGSAVANYPGSTTHKIAVASGTSLATPVAAGVVCLLMQLRPWMTPAECRHALRQFARTGRLDESATSYEASAYYTGAGTRVLHNPFGCTGSRLI